jgi:hypothetical protein
VDVSMAVITMHPRDSDINLTNMSTGQLHDTVSEKLTVTQLVNKFPTFCGTRNLITVFTRTHHWSLS